MTRDFLPRPRRSFFSVYFYSWEMEFLPHLVDFTSVRELTIKPDQVGQALLCDWLPSGWLRVLLGENNHQRRVDEKDSWVYTCFHKSVQTIGHLGTKLFSSVPLLHQIVLESMHSSKCALHLLLSHKYSHISHTSPCVICLSLLLWTKISALLT